MLRRAFKKKRSQDAVQAFSNRDLGKQSLESRAAVTVDPSSEHLVYSTACNAMQIYFVGAHITSNIGLPEHSYHKRPDQQF